ncbi:N-acetyltransferase [Methanobacterium sp.]|uniref:GNAT family N-acetyltransferase n=1 Tax=Methanobacterium sp. TaxID=2164 RepID=UPI0025F0EE41|nr:GNAT family N-acetyltransferase [Methanobacterium sp.]MBI5459415.1 GNAT family N-acetyltransferase [Methanobacterium sp.]
MVNIVFIETGAFDLDLIQQLWEKLNDHHRKQKSDFKEHYENFTFPERAEALLKKSLEGDMHIGRAEEKKTGLLVAYCITTISPDNEGEIDSIYVEEEYRGHGFGDELIKRSLEWMDKKGVKKKTVRVAVGNQDAVSFYERYGFRPRSITLEQTANQER